MKRLSVLLFCVFLVCSFAPPGDLEEVIRRKIENMAFQPLTVGADLVHCTQALPVFYASNDFQQVWTNAEEIDAFTDLLASASEHGLNPNDYHLEQIQRSMASGLGPLTKKAELEILLTDAWLLFASHMVAGKVNPQSIDPQWHVTNAEVDVLALLTTAVSEQRLAKSIEQMQPQNATYKSLKEALQSYKQLREKGGWEAVKEGETLKPGMTDERIATVRQRLLATGELQNPEAAEPQLFDDTLKAAVIAFQKRHGIDADGNIGMKTLTAMNVSVDQRIAQIRANLERWRWLDQQLSNYHIMVNIADYKLEVVRGGVVERTHRVMVGKPFRQTPVFSSYMQYLVLNPTWTVPPTILKNDILPAVRKNPEYLNTKGLVVMNNEGQAVDPGTIDWNSKQAASYTYRQPAGKNNALGVVKFMFPNTYNIYLHDTPSKELFSKTERAFSSGCIRLENPLDLAKHLLKNESAWSASAIDQAVAKGVTQTVTLSDKPEVYLLYWTAWTDAEGKIQFRPDVYERDQKLIDALLKEDPTEVN